MISKNQLIRNRSSLILKGTATIVFGLVALAHPGEDIQRMMLPFGLLVLLSGLIGICRSCFFLKPSLPLSKIIMIKGITESFIGLSALLFLQAEVEFFLVLISLWLILTGMIQAVRARALKSIFDSYLMASLSGWIVAAFGILLLLNINLQWFELQYEVAVFAILMGGMMIYIYFMIRELRDYLGHHPKKTNNRKNTVYYDRAY
ncbi:MAG: DUF308 domain-containing protein [Cyclobacteriaceae bacterium]